MNKVISVLILYFLYTINGQSNNILNNEISKNNVLPQGPLGRNVPPQGSLGRNLFPQGPLGLSGRKNEVPVGRLSDDPKCAEDLKRICGNDLRSLSNFAVLECVQNRERDDSALISSECHHVLWTYKYELTTSSRIADLAKDVCKQDFSIFNKCTNQNTFPYGNAISCMVENIDQFTDEKCRQYVVRLGAVVFSDFHLVQPLTDSCRNDIERHGCGRVQSSVSDEPHSQGLTSECLSKQVGSLEPQCQVQILRLAELQSEDFHLDRAFYFACREARDRFCQNLKAGKGQVYKCLLHHQNDRTMGQECAEQLSRRQKLIAHDYKVSKGLVRACRLAIKENQCRKGLGKDELEVKLSKILLCLEGALHRGKVIDGDCQEEMLVHRQLLLESSPNVIEKCKPEIVELCSGYGGPSKLHCLMKHYKKRGKQRVSIQCQRALEDVIKETDPAEDWRVDPVLYDSCLPVVQTRCKGLKGGEGRVIRCLMRQMESQYMTPNCAAALLEIQYFVARDWKLDPQLFSSCRNDSIKLCHARGDWANPSTPPGADNSILVLPCLFRYAYHPSPELRLSQLCSADVHRVMHERAAFVDLHPQIEMECLEPLASLCSDNTAPGEEIMCLQKNLEKLGDISISCQELVKNYTEAEAKDVGLNNLIMTHCSDIMQQLCSHVLQNEESEPGAVMDCLIQNKNIPAMRDEVKCRAVVENFQIIMIKDLSFTPKFKQDCHESVRQFCNNARNRKEVLDCLSERILKDILHDDRSSVTKPCKTQVRKQIAQKHESLNLDPDLKKACSQDVKRLCIAVTGPGAVLECLRSHRTELSGDCHHAVFEREQEESVDPTTDVVLVSACRQMIKAYCSQETPSQIFDCLMREKDDPGFDMKCRELLLRRQEERSKDVILNPQLYRSCRGDIQKLCRVEAGIKVLVERNGKVIECLKEKLPQKKLSPKCEMNVIQMTKNSALNFKLDPILLEKCEKDMKILCPKGNEDSERGEMEECLKLQLEQGRIVQPECRLHMAEIMQRERADIHADPLLLQSCAIDDTKFCADRERGSHLACLYDILDRNAVALEKQCREKLRERREMFKVAIKVSKLESVEDLVEGVRTSPQRTLFIVILFSLVGIIFLGGLTCGRISRRSYKLLKNR